MKFINNMIHIFTKRNRRKENVRYYDNYTLFGSIMGGYCGLLKFNHGNR